MFDIYERAVGGNSTFLLNIPPNRDGKFSPTDVAVLKETGQRIRETYGTDLFRQAKGPKELLDQNADTYVTVDKDEAGIVISTPQPVTLNRLVIQEAIATNGERVEKHAVDAWIEGGWKEIAHATNIGYKRILRFPDVTTDKIRVRILESRLTPAICTISAHHYKARPPRLSAQRSIDGLVTIEPMAQEFGWKAHGENIAENLNAGFKIYYTTDGTEPSAGATEYKAPFQMGNSELKAVAILNGEKGATLQERFGLIKKGWKPAGKTSDYIAIDLGSEQTISGFAYTPKKEGGKGTVGGTIRTSDDGKSWKEAESFEFGNLVNDPSKRFHHFKKAVKARYVKIEAAEIAAGTEEAAIAEIDLF